MNIIAPQSLSKQEKDFCELYACGTDPYCGNARKCYSEIFLNGANDKFALKCARELMSRPDINDYLTQLESISQYKPAEMKAIITEKLLKIMEETATAQYTDRRGTKLSVAPLRSVSVQASKALMDMYPVRVAQENKLEVNGNGESGITFNVIVPQKPDEQEQQ